MKICSIFFLGATILFAPVTGLLAGAQSRTAKTPVCQLAEINGEVKAGDAFVTPLGGGLEFRLKPLPGNAGWDIQVDQQGRHSYPDYVELATPPYRSMNERELATTYGVRAQEAIGWSPRSFRFLTDPAMAASATRSFLLVTGLHKSEKAAMSQVQAELGYALAHSSQGELKVVDARIVQGIGDPVRGSGEWAERLAHTPHQTEAVAHPTAVGELRWVRFRVRLWMPGGWSLPKPIAKGTASRQH